MNERITKIADVQPTIKIICQKKIGDILITHWSCMNNLSSFYFFFHLSFIPRRSNLKSAIKERARKNSVLSWCHLLLPSGNPSKCTNKNRQFVKIKYFCFNSKFVTDIFGIRTVLYVYEEADQALQYTRIVVT